MIWRLALVLQVWFAAPALARTGPQTPLAEGVLPAYRRWFVSELKRTPDSRPEIVAWLPDTSKDPRRPGDRARLVLQCINGVTSVFIGGEQIAAPGRPTIVALRIGEGDLRLVQFRADDTGSYVGTWNSRAAAALIRELAGAGTLTVRLRTDRTQEYMFVLDGIAGPVARLGAECGW